MEIGHRIKQLRVERRITLNELAKRIGLTTSFLSQLERELTSPSVNSLEKIARALHVRVADFFQEGEKKELIVVKKGAGRQSADKKGRVFTETLASGIFDINMKSQLFSLGVGAVLTSDLLPRLGEKFIMVLKGVVEFFGDKEKFVLGEGDSVYCARTGSPSKIVNIGKKEARVICISFLPV